MTVTFQGTAPLTFMSTLAIGTWAKFSIPADPNPIASPVIHLQQFSTTVVEVTTTGGSEVAFEVNEDAGAAYLQLRVDNRSGSPLSVLVPGGDTVTIPPSQSVDVTYNRALASARCI